MSSWVSDLEDDQMLGIAGQAFISGRGMVIQDGCKQVIGSVEMEISWKTLVASA